MNIKFLLFVVSAAAISSCSTAYKSGQTPDDVYYSPARVEEDYVQKNQEEVKKDDSEDREIRMAVYDWRWRTFDGDYNYYYDPYRYGYSYGYYYNPYYCHYPVYITNVFISNPKNSVPRMANLGSYNNSTYSVTNPKNGSGIRLTPTRPYNNSNNSTITRRINVLPSSNSSNNSTETNSTRSYTPSSSNNSSSSGSSSSGSSGTSVSRPGRGG